MSDPEMVSDLFMDALKWAGLAAVIVYFQGKYLDA
jgi:hypothetical protein